MGMFTIREARVSYYTCIRGIIKVQMFAAGLPGLPGCLLVCQFADLHASRVVVCCVLVCWCASVQN